MTDVRSEKLRLPASMVADQDRLAHGTTQVGGVVARVSKSLGNVVKKGEVLAEIESIEMGQAINEYLIARASYPVAQRRHEQQLATSGAMQKLVERQERLFKNAQEFLALLKANPSASEARKQSAGLQLGKVKSEILNALADVELSQSTFKREEDLLKEQVGTQKNFLEAKARLETVQASYASLLQQLELESETELLERQMNFLEVQKEVLETEKDSAEAAAELAAAERRLSLLGFSGAETAALTPEMAKSAFLMVRAPINGVIVERNLVVGEFTEAGRKLFTLLDHSVLWASATLFDRDLPRVKEGQTAKISWEGLPNPSFEGKVTYVDRLVDPAQRTARVLISVPNPEGALRPGLFVTVELETGD
ncbi:MAG: efflux RND transporter periplasmic adaptor subunit [Planctomycetes bacterium]|nr:efflux RND transporter periplasmic adaptor subunit [Planctomycetota bacterium]